MGQENLPDDRNAEMNSLLQSMVDLALSERADPSGPMVGAQREVIESRLSRLSDNEREVLETALYRELMILDSQRETQEARRSAQPEAGFHQFDSETLGILEGAWRTVEQRRIQGKDITKKEE